LETDDPNFHRYLEHRMLYANGSVGHMAVRFFVVKDSQGKTIKTYGINQDITERKRAEEVLRESEERFRVIFEQANDAIFITNAADEILVVNPCMCEMTGYSREELLQMHIADLQAPEVRQSGNIVKNELARHGNIVFEGLDVHRDGHRIPVEISVARIAGLQGELYVSVVRDITERKRAEAALRVSEARLRAILDATPFPIALVDVQDNTIDFWSRSALSLFGHTAPTAPEWYQIAYPDPDYRREVIDRWKPALEKAQVSAQAVNTGEYRVTCRDGSVRLCELYAAFLADRLVVTFNDITERKRAEEALRESEERYRILIENAREAIYVAQQEKIVFANTASGQLTGTSQSELLGKSILDLVPEQDRERVQKHHAQIASGAIPADQTELQLLVQGGDKRWLIVNAVRIEWEGNPATLNFAIDITERKRAEAALRVSEQRFREFFEHETNYCYRISPEGIILDLNPSALRALGYASKDEIVGKPLLTAVYAPASRDRARQLFLRWKATGQLKDEELSIITKTGEERTVILNVSAVKDAADKILHSVSIQTDITERKRAEEALKEKMRELQRFNNLTVDRELRMIELKQEINALLKQTGAPEKYKIIGSLNE
jgi:PAS domain S-box-containing protein